jgi:hypothetical protein
MSDTQVNTQVVNKTNESQEAPQQTPEREASPVAKTLSSRDSHARVTDYEQKYVENDFRTVEAGDQQVTILSSEKVGNEHNAENDRDYAISVATHSQYRKFENGGLNRPAHSVQPAERSVDQTVASGLRRGLVRG